MLMPKTSSEGTITHFSFPLNIFPFEREVKKLHKHPASGHGPSAATFTIYFC